VRKVAGWGGFLGKIADQFQGRIERLKNEKEKLLNERQSLLRQSVTVASSDRIMRIDVRVQQINQALSSKASD
jgi:uncharacterized protein (UPF0335 family)